MESLRKNKMKLFFNITAIVWLSLFINACGTDSTLNKNNYEENKDSNKNILPEVKPVTMINYTVVNRYPHDISLFTEGFLFHDNKLFESTGAPDHLPQTKSSFGIVDLKTGKFDQKAEIDKKIYFGEGMLVLNKFIYQLTYTNQIGFIYDSKTYERRGQFSYRNKQGWGLTTEGKHIIMSDGTNELSYLNPSDFSLVKTLNVTENGFALDFINELEYIKGYIYANVWMTDFIVKIDPQTGVVVGKLDLSALKSESKSGNINLAEMNGIAYDSINDRIMVTGKLWPTIYELKFEH